MRPTSLAASDEVKTMRACITAKDEEDKERSVVAKVHQGSISNIPRGDVTNQGRE
jgi:hypothetical protein